MARGFGTTLGVGTTDNVTGTLNTLTAQRSVCIWSNRNGDGAGGFGRIWAKAVGDLDALSNDAAGIYAFGRIWSTTAGQWSIVRPSASAWHHILVVYDGTSTANNPVIYVDGVSVTVTLVATPAGTISSDTTNPYTIGNNKATNRNWDGMLAEFAIWDALLDAAEAKALGNGAIPSLIRPQSLVEYEPMLRDNVAPRGAAPTITGTAVQPHPRVYSSVGAYPVAVGGILRPYYYDMLAA